MSKLEKDAVLSIRMILERWQFTGEVLWFSRLNSGQIRVGMRWIRLCEPGTPDFLALVRGRNNELIALFIEVKSDTGKLSENQREFRDKHHNGKDIYVLEVNNPQYLDHFINEISVDRLKEITL